MMRGPGGPKYRRWAYAAALVITTGAALSFRLPYLDNRPFHADEAVHAFKLRDLRETGVYTYDPDEYHGPTLYYAALPVMRALAPQAFGNTSERDYRLPVALIGALLIPLVALLRDGLGRRATVVAALLVTVSPGFVFFSRYFIQEMLLVAFTLGALCSWWRYRQGPNAAWAMAAACFVGLMVATKETAALTLGSWFAASLLVRRSSPCEGTRRTIPSRRTVVAVLMGGAVAALLLSGMGQNAHALLDLFRAYTPWLERAHGTDVHRQAWSYYLGVLGWTHRAAGPVWTEAFVLALAAVGAWTALRRRVRDDAALLQTRIVVCTVILLAAYSAIPYKTPWCVLSPLLGILLMAGMGASRLLRGCCVIAPSAEACGPGQTPGLRTGAACLGLRHALVSLALALGFAATGYQAYQTSYVFQADPRNPYVYAHTARDAEEMRVRAETLAAHHPDGTRMVVKVIWNDTYYWPIPWLLRRFDHVGYWTSVPDDADAPLVLASPEFDEELTKRLDATHLMNGYVALRPRVFAQVWVRMDLWTRYIEWKQRNAPPEDEQ